MHDAAKLLPLLDNECEFAFEKEIGPPDDWTCHTAAELCAKLMHRTTSRILMGHELCRDDAYLRTSQSLTDSIFVYGLAMSMLPMRSLLRGAYDFIFSIFHRRALNKALMVILPVVESRFAEFQTRSPGPINKQEEHCDSIEWSLSLTKGNPKEHNPHWIAYSLLHNIWAGSAAPGGLVTQMVFQVLMEQPEKYLEPLRSEVQTALDKHGGYTDKALNSMVNLDSFVREISRVYPTGSVTCARTIMNPRGFQFHDGLFLPQGTRLAVPALAIQTDADNFRDPHTVDGFRFARLREAARHRKGENEQRWGAGTASETNLA